MSTSDSAANLLQFEAFSASPARRTDWVWDGFLARGMITLLTSRWKSGKTTLLSVLLSRFTTGGTLAGGTITPGRAVIISEEPADLWQQRHEQLQFGPEIRRCCRPFAGRPNADQWALMITQLCREPLDLVVFDPLSMFLPGSVENSAAELLDVLEPLHRLAEGGAAVLLIHHPRKARTAGDSSPRGTGALTGFADILIDLDRPLHIPSDRCRRLSVSSRLRGNFQCCIELTADGRDYLPVEEPPDRDGFEAGWPALKIALEDSPQRLTRREILQQWPEDYDKPSRTTLFRWLAKALKEGLILRKGIGRNHDPYTYCLKDFVPYFDDLPPREPIHYDLMRSIRERKAQAQKVQAAAPQ